MKTVKQYVVSYQSGNGNLRIWHESKHMNSIEECEEWVRQNLPYGTQKCRDGYYEINESYSEEL